MFCTTLLLGVFSYNPLWYSLSQCLSSVFIVFLLKLIGNKVEFEWLWHDDRVLLLHRTICFLMIAISYEFNSLLTLVNFS